MARKKKSDIIDYAQQPQVPQALVEELPMGKVVEDAYIRFGSYVNTSRHFLGLKDGLKPSYRRLYYISSTFKKGEWIPNNTLLGSVSRIHPHGVDSLLGVVSVFAISGVFDFKGSPGHTNLLGQTSEPAAARYTKSKISDLYLRIMGGTLSEVNMIPSPNEEKEPEYIPTPIPLGMILNERSLGLGVGISTNVPTFDPKSLLNAYLNDNPQLLEPRTDIIIDKSKSDLQKLWETGQGNIHYKLRVGRVTTPDNREGILVEGDSLIFTPDWNKRIKKWEAENKLTIDDCTDITGPKVLIARIPGARNLTIDEIEKECLRICQKSIKFTIYATDGSSTFRIPIRNWIDYTYNNYINLISQVNQKRIGQIEFEIAVQEALPIVVDYVMNKNPKAENKELEKNLGIPIEIIESVMSKPIAHLRKTKDTTERVKALKKRLAELKKFDPVKHTFDIVQEM